MGANMTIADNRQLLQWDKDLRGCAWPASRVMAGSPGGGDDGVAKHSTGAESIERLTGELARRRLSRGETGTTAFV